MKCKGYFGILAALFLLTACSGSGEDGDMRQRGVDGKTVQLRLSFPVGDLGSRGPGDPGVTEILSAPTYAWIFFVDQSGNVPPVGSVQYKDGENWYNLPRRVTMTGFFGDTVKESYAGSLSVTDDVVWRFPMKMLQFVGVTSGKFYIVASNVPLKSGGTPLEDVSVSTEEDILDLDFDLYNADMREDIGNIYSTPYNYNIGSPSSYYGSWKGGADDIIDLLLYHVAARVDVKWNVDETLQPTRKVKTLQVGGLKSKGCKIFRPMDNNTLGADPYTITLKTSSEIGRQWYGRQAFYAIPYTDSPTTYFPIDFTVDNGTEENTTSIKLNMMGANTVFVPWIRLNMTYDEDADFTQSELLLNE